LSTFDGLLIGQWLQHVRPQHPGSTVSQAHKVIDEAVILLLRLSIQKYFEREDRLGLDDEQILQ
jgi:hypothetical protein